MIHRIYELLRCEYGFIFLPGMGFYVSFHMTRHVYYFRKYYEYYGEGG